MHILQDPMDQAHRLFHAAGYNVPENNIEYIDSQTANIVIINNQSDKAFLSLKRQQGLFKCRFEGSSKWYTFSKKALIDKFSNKDEL